MSIKLKQIAAILANHDVRDPRGALLAIEKVVAQPKAKKPKAPKPLLQLALVKTGPKTGTVTVKFDRDNLKPSHVVKVIESLEQFGSDTFGDEQCDDPNCPVHGTGATDLGELFKQFEEVFDGRRKEDRA